MTDQNDLRIITSDTLRMFLEQNNIQINENTRKHFAQYLINMGLRNERKNNG